jgi:uncharacterized protein YecT (DUF1311 family)
MNRIRRRRQLIGAGRGMRLVASFVLIAGLALAAPGRAQESAAEAACIALPPPAQSGCLEKLARAADVRLNSVYRQAMRIVERSDDAAAAAAWKDELEKAEQAWIAFRDTDCGALVGYEWGHGTGMGAATESCLLQKTRQRIRELTGRYIERR